MDELTRLKIVKTFMNWGRPTKCSCCGEPIEKKTPFLHLHKKWGTIEKNFYLCKDCIIACEEMAFHEGRRVY